LTKSFRYIIIAAKGGDKMPSDRFTKSEAQNCIDALEEIMKAFPRSKAGEFLSHFDEILLFLKAAKEAAQ
jgi:hypothetical protein